MTAHTLITGAAGYLGDRIARKMLAETDHTLVLWTRANAAARVAERFRDHRERVIVRAGELTDEQPFAQVDARSIGTIIHAAAVTRFDVDADNAQATNVAGTAKLLAFAERCPSLGTFVYLSSIYSTGLDSGRMDEVAGRDPCGFANEYERSKWHAERLVLAGTPRFRRQILRVASVLCDDDSGAVTQHNVVHQLLRLLYGGLLPIVPGHPTTPCYLVTGELVAAACVALVDHGDDGAVFHVSPARDASCTMQELLDWSHEALCRDDRFRRRRVLKPLFADEATFDYLARTATTFSSDVGPVILVVRPFAKQLFVHKDVHNDRLVAAWPQYRLPAMRELVDRTCEWLARRTWNTGEER